MTAIRTVAIIGAGTMGHSFAQVFAQKGLQVSLTDLRYGILGRAKSLIASNLGAEVEAGLLEQGQVESVVARIRMTTRIEEACAEADFVIEAITENQAAKKDMFATLDRVCPPRTIIASNTSFMDIFKFVETRRPDKILITHWFAPPHIVPLVEVVRGPQTAQETVDTVTALLTRIGKMPIVISKFLPGFVANRLQSALTNEMLFLIDNGYATPEDIDKAAKGSFGFRMPLLGVVKKVDFAGVDQIRRSFGNGLYRAPPDRTISETMDRLVAEGRLGVKSGRGFFDYGGRSTEEIVREMNLKLLKLREFLRGLDEL
ncbi:MAG TPA: 3-hydroxyacyl-CoA dehydrogenase family protein [Burkholderiales bacterium]|nr:3-hydroxyacyl-CoA dehydrogenase family protein [Burkholderiales bacterium]